MRLMDRAQSDFDSQPVNLRAGYTEMGPMHYYGEALVNPIAPQTVDWEPG
jgi:hypothetical protein